MDRKRPVRDWAVQRRRTVNLPCTGAFLQAASAVASANGISLGQFIVDVLSESAHGGEIARIEARLIGETAPDSPTGDC